MYSMLFGSEDFALKETQIGDARFEPIIFPPDIQRMRLKVLKWPCDGPKRDTLFLKQRCIVGRLYNGTMKVFDSG